MAVKRATRAGEELYKCPRLSQTLEPLVAAASSGLGLLLHIMESRDLIRVHYEDPRG